MPRVSADQRRTQFVHAAARVIADHGVAAATTRRIAAEAQAPLASLHYCFDNKEELLQDVYYLLSRDYASALPPVHDPGAGLATVIREHADRIWERMLANPHEQVTTFELLLRRFRVDTEEKPRALAMNRSMYSGWVRSTTALFVEAAHQADEPVPTNLELVSRLFISGVDGISMQHLADPDHERSRSLVRMLAESVTAQLQYG